MYRARIAADDPSTPDLVASITDVCLESCEFGPISIAVQVANQGGSDVDAGAILSVYAEGGGLPRFVTSIRLPAIVSGERIEGIEIELQPGDLGVYGFSVTVDDDGSEAGLAHGTVSECDEDNNSDAYSDIFCE